MKTSIDICHQPFDVDFTYDIRVSENRAEHIAMEFEVTEVLILDVNNNYLICPKWLHELIAEEIEEDSVIYDAILEEEHG